MSIDTNKFEQSYALWSVFIGGNNRIDLGFRW